MTKEITLTRLPSRQSWFVLVTFNNSSVFS